MKAQISIVELTLAMVLFAGFSASFGLIDQPSLQDPQLQLESLSESLYYLGDYRESLLLENLSDSTPSQDWSSLESILDSELTNYELVVGNQTVEKILQQCQGTFYESFSEKFVTVLNETEYDFRFIRIGVCY